MTQWVGNFGDMQVAVTLIGCIMVPRIGHDRRVGSIAIFRIGEFCHCPGCIGQRGDLVINACCRIGELDDVASRIGDLREIIVLHVGVGGFLSQGIGGAGQVAVDVVGVLDLAPAGIGDGDQPTGGVIAKSGCAPLSVSDGVHFAISLIVDDVVAVLILIID